MFYAEDSAALRLLASSAKRLADRLAPSDVRPDPSSMADALLERIQGALVDDLLAAEVTGLPEPGAVLVVVRIRPSFDPEHRTVVVDVRRLPVR